MPRVSQLVLVVALALAAAALAGCRESEQGRPLVYEKGSYRGKADTPLDTDTVRALQQRGRQQGY